MDFFDTCYLKLFSTDIFCLLGVTELLFLCIYLFYWLQVFYFSLKLCWFARISNQTWICRLYLENEDEIKLYNISKKLEGAFNEYLEFFFETGISSINKHYSGSHVLKFDEDLNQMIVSPEGVKIVSNYKKKYEAYILERNDKNKKRIDTQQIKI